MQTKNLTDIYKWVWVVLIILAVFLGIQTLSAFKGLRDSAPSYNSITVTGEGEAFAVPDVASFSFTVSADAPTVSAAQEEAGEKIDAILGKLKDLGIEEKDIKTVDYSVWPKYIYSSIPCSPSYCPPSTQKQDGYTANHSISVKVRKTEEAGTVLAAAGDSGATNLSGISFTIDDPEKITSEARNKAIENAREKAKILAHDLDVRLVKVVSFSDSTDGGGFPPYYAREGMGMGGDVAVSQVKNPTIPTGENKVRVIVNITYEIR